MKNPFRRKQKEITVSFVIPKEVVEKIISEVFNIDSIKRAYKPSGKIDAMITDIIAAEFSKIMQEKLKDNGKNTD